MMVVLEAEWKEVGEVEECDAPAGRRNPLAEWFDPVRIYQLRNLNQLATPFLADEGDGEDDYSLLPPPKRLYVMQLTAIAFFAVSVESGRFEVS